MLNNAVSFQMLFFQIGGQKVMKGCSQSWTKCAFLLFVLMLFAMGVDVKSANADAADFQFTVNPDGKTATITGYTGTDVDIVIPETVVYDGETLTVTRIGTEAFSGTILTNKLKSVVIPDTVTEIGNGAFYGNELVSITLPGKLTILGGAAFRYNKLESITIPESLTVVSDASFQNNNLKSVTIPNGVTTIGVYAFANNPLESVTFPDTLTTIHEGAFLFTNLTSVTIPKNVNYIDILAFAYTQISFAVIESDSINFKGDPFYMVSPKPVIFCPDQSDVCKYLNDNDFGYTSYDIDSVQFENNGGTWAKSHSVKVTLLPPNSSDADYIWSTSPETPDLTSDGWEPLNNVSYTPPSPSQSGAWYLHIKAKAEIEANNVTWVRRSQPFYVDLTAPSLQLSAPGGWTNQDVTVTVTASDSESDVAELKYAFGQYDAEDFAAVTDTLDPSGPKITVTQNGWLSVYAKDLAGNETVEQIQITNIDRSKPDIVLTLSTHAPTNQDVTVTATATDDKSGVKLLKWAYGQKDETFFQSAGETFSGSFTATMNGTYTVYAEDNAGNRAIRHIQIDHIFKTGPTILLTPLTTAPTNQPVTVTANVYAQAGLAIVKYDFGQHDEAYFATAGLPLNLNDPQIIVTGNGWVSIYAEDLAHNQIVEQIEITNIDKVKPVITLLGDAVMRLPLGSAFKEPGYTATDDVSGDITGDVVISGDAVDTGKPGTYTILYDVSDEAGNAADQVQRTVIVYASSSGSGGGGPNLLPNQWIVYAGEAKTIRWKDELILSFPAGAAGETLIITISEAEDEPALTASLGPNHSAISTIYEIVKDKPGRFLKPVTLSIRFDPAKAGPNRTVAIFYYDEEERKWVSLGGTAEGEWVTAETDHFTKFAVVAIETQDEAAPERKPVFSDIAGHWGEASILEAAEKRLVTGYPDGTFRPDQAVTRAEFLVMLVRTLGLEGGLEALPFVDEGKIGSWAKEAVATAVQKGIVVGYEDGSFRPDAPITRAEMAVMLAKALGLKDQAEVRTGFADGHEIPAWAKDAAEALRQQGIVQGRDGNRFAPQHVTTRAEAAVVLLNIMKH